MITQFTHKFAVSDRVYVLFPDVNCPYLICKVEKIRFELDSKDKPVTSYFIEQDDASKFDMFKLIELHYGIEEVIDGIKESRLLPFSESAKHLIKQHKKTLLQRELRRLNLEKTKLRKTPV